MSVMEINGVALSYQQRPTVIGQCGLPTPHSNRKWRKTGGSGRVTHFESLLTQEPFVFGVARRCLWFLLAFERSDLPDIGSEVD